MIDLKNVLVATDFGPASETALRYGRALAENFGARLHLLHVTHSIYLTAATAYGYAPPFEAQEDIERAARKQAEALLTDKDREALRATATIVTDPSPAFAAVEYARDNDIDLMVLGTHGRGPLSHILLGSVAERIVRTAPCPVLTVRDPEHEFVVPDAAAATVCAPRG